MKKAGKDTAAQEDAPRRLSAQSLPESVTCLTFDDYQCSGNIQVDFPKLCALLDKKSIPPVHSKIRKTERERTPAMKRSWKQIVTHLMKENEVRTTALWTKPYLCVDLENKSQLSSKGLRIIGWEVDEQIMKVLNKLLQDLSQLQSIHFWRARLTDEMVLLLSSALSLRVVYLEGNPLPRHSFHLLLSNDSVITHLFLRNNHIGDEGARLIGAALSTPKTSNKNLLFLSLAFNSIGDAGAAYLAQGLRLNRTLLFLSLANNQIGDSGAAHLSRILGEFPLTHEEVVERRKLLSWKTDWTSVGLDPQDEGAPAAVKVDSKPNAKKKEMVKKDEKPAPVQKETPKKGQQKTAKAAAKAAQQKGLKSAAKKKPTPADAPEEKMTISEIEETVHPLLDLLVQSRDRQLFLSGNSTLIYLSLAGNILTEKSLPSLLSSLEQQTEGGLLRLCLKRNNISSECELLQKIEELLEPRLSQISETTE
ncbi:unnamed protein product [Knipowitschia caucasica]|uniref:Leucine-rich repeat-containing protein 71 n=1 Tax=Knipowitschia caucasica TaxID=637954 RepID=A0AAV2K4P3_KNICA